MKKIILLIIMLLPIKIFAISASSVVAMDLDTGRVLYGYNIDEERLIASTTKIMTAIIAIERGELDKTIKVSDIIYESFGSGIYIEVGEEITLRDLIYGLLLRSGNDAALAISEAVAGSKEEFVYLMNGYASNIGMKHTKFYNPHGLEEKDGVGNISTAYDMALLTKYAMENSTFREIFKTKERTVKTNYKTYVWHNKNKLLSEEYITGGKTGFTQKARRTLVTTGSKNNMNIVVVTLNDPNDWSDHKDIYQDIFSKYESFLILNKDDFKIEDEKYYQEDTLYINNNYYLTLTKKELKSVSIEYTLNKDKNYINDNLVGYANIKINDKVYHKEPIYVKKSTKKEKLSWWQRIKRWFTKW